MKTEMMISSSRNLKYLTDKRYRTICISNRSITYIGSYGCTLNIFDFKSKLSYTSTKNIMIILARAYVWINTARPRAVVEDSKKSLQTYLIKYGSIFDPLGLTLFSNSIKSKYQNISFLINSD